MCDIYPDAFNSQTRKARKNHICCECRGRILAKEQYEYSSGIWEGRPDSFKTCLACIEAEKKFNSILGSYCFNLGDMYQDTRDFAEDKAKYPSAHVNGLKPGQYFSILREIAKANKRFRRRKELEYIESTTEFNTVPEAAI